jgi:hypothetical protein
MSEDKKDYSNNLNLDFNKQENQISETADDKEKIYNPPDIIKIKEEKENFENIENIDVKEKDKIYFPPDIDKVKKNIENIDENLKDEEFMTTLKRLLTFTMTIEYFIDQTEKVIKDKEKIMNSFAELKKRRLNENIVTKEEILLLEYLFYHYKEQFLMRVYQKINEDFEMNKISPDYKKSLEEEIKEKEKENPCCVVVMVKLLQTEKYNPNRNKDKLGKENLDFLKNFNFNNSNNNIIFPNELIQDKKSRSNEYNFFYCLGDCFSAIYNFCFKIGDRNDFKGLNLHKFFFYYIIENLLFLSMFLNDLEFKEEQIPAIYMLIIILSFTIYIFYKLFLKKYHEEFTSRTCCIIFYMFMIIAFKVYIYALTYFIIKYEIKHKTLYKVFMACFSIKILFLLYCYIYFFISDGLVKYANLTIFGFVILLLAGLISFFWFSLRDVIIELIICSVQMILLHIGINVARCKESLRKTVIWNTLNIEVFEWTIILYPAMIGTYIILIIVTFGIFYFVMKDINRSY